MRMFLSPQRMSLIGSSVMVLTSTDQWRMAIVRASSQALLSNSDLTHIRVSQCLPLLSLSPLVSLLPSPLSLLPSPLLSSLSSPSEVHHHILFLQTLDSHLPHSFTSFCPHHPQLCNCWVSVFRVAMFLCPHHCSCLFRLYFYVKLCMSTYSPSPQLW